nr:hypothetical protein [Bacillota bacterium]
MTIASDAARAVMERALSRSAEALSRFLGDRVLRPSYVTLTTHRLAELPILWGRAEMPIAGVVLEVRGDLEGFLLLIVPQEDCAGFLQSLMGGPCDDEELAESALGEMGNVVCSAFLNELADTYAMRINPSPPAVVCDMVGALLETLAAALAMEKRSELPVVRAQLAGNGQGSSAYLLWIPGRGDLERLEALS